MQRKQTGRLGLEEAAAFNTALDTNERLKRGLDDLACAYPELTQDETWMKCCACSSRRACFSRVKNWKRFSCFVGRPICCCCEMIKHRRCRAVLRGQMFSTPFGVFSFCERAGAEIHIMIGEDPRSAGAFRIVPAEVDRHEKAAKAVAKSVLRLSDLGKDIRGGWAEVSARQAFYGESAA